jgi:hypothetical protein
VFARHGAASSVQKPSSVRNLPCMAENIAKVIWRLSRSDCRRQERSPLKQRIFPSRRVLTACSYAVFPRSLTLAQRALCAAAILFRPAAEIVRCNFGAGFGPCPFALAHRFFCARLIFLRAEADKVRCPFSLDSPRAVSAALNRWTSCCALFSSFFKCATAPDMFPIGALSTRNCD